MAHLITLEAHNAAIAECRMEADNLPRKNGIECPKCKAELFDLAPNMVLLVQPAQKRVRCAKCGWSGARLA